MVRLVQHYAPILNERIGRGIRHPNDPELGGLARGSKTSSILSIFGKNA